MSVRAKFKVASIAQTENYDKTKPDFKTVELTPVVDGTPENKAFFASTPGGSIKLGIINEAAAEQFKVGGQYYVDFASAE